MRPHQHCTIGAFEAAPHGDVLIDSTPEPAGVNCTYGGWLVEVGLDLNDNGLLEPAEVTSSEYVCNPQGTQAVIETSVEPAGANCAEGGLRIDSGVDLDGNGMLDAGEITDTDYVCNGAGGTDGADGANGMDGANGIDGKNGADGSEGGCAVGGHEPGSWLASALLALFLALRPRRRSAAG